jgi:DNA-directed RNA polymerase specialized sigma24 family protein
MSDELANFEGLVFRTAQMYVPFVQEEEDDIRQLLRIKVWQALTAYDPAKVRGQSREEYVFMCVKNRVKDLLKRKHRPEDFIEDKAPSDAAMRAAFEGRYLAHDEEAEVEAICEGRVELPSTLTLLEVHVVRLLLLDLNQTEISTRLGVSRAKVREAHASVKLKMADWGQDNEPAPLATGQRLSLAA